MLPKVVVIGLSPREIKWFWSENLSELYVINCEENETGNFKLFISRSDFCCELRKEYENKILTNDFGPNDPKQPMNNALHDLMWLL